MLLAPRADLLPAVAARPALPHGIGCRTKVRMERGRRCRRLDWPKGLRGPSRSPCGEVGGGTSRGARPTPGERQRARQKEAQRQERQGPQSLPPGPGQGDGPGCSVADGSLRPNEALRRMERRLVLACARHERGITRGTHRGGAPRHRFCREVRPLLPWLLRASTGAAKGPLARRRRGDAAGEPPTTEAHFAPRSPPAPHRP